MKCTIFYLIIGLIFGGCKGSNSVSISEVSEVSGVSAQECSSTAGVYASAFNHDSAYRFVVEQLAFGQRVPGSKAHRECALYMAGRLRDFADTVFVQEFSARRWDGAALRGSNIIASFNPSASQRVFLCAHWDSRPYADNENDEALHRRSIDGANDGASGVGVLLEIARVLSLSAAVSVGVDIVLFDLEDSGKPRFEQTQYGDEKTWCLGSQYWAANPHVAGYRASYGILLDMVGVRNATFKQEGTSLHYAPDIMAKVWKTASALGYGRYFVYEQATPIIDDHLFINQIAGIPTIDIIALDGNTPHGFFPHWHTLQDNIENIDKQTLKMVGDVVLKTINN
ncbi:MAG: M28 family peptidase [Bacteroidales bacterium]|nr:M28 family peptidase [Bacteroidales bacterium]